jgi:hypothetical protein
VNAQTMIGNLAWAPLSSLEEIEVLDRFNGVPTLGVFGTPGQKTLFWRALGYVPPHQVSLWLYVPLADEDEAHLENAEPSDLLQGLIINSRTRRTVIVGIAHEYRIAFQFDWPMPRAAVQDDLIRELLSFTGSELADLLRHSITPSRKKEARRASKAVRELAVCAA